ncbi:unnamed protein product [Rotaria sordida]|uniref:Uncharacterized protein n=1 Tax=Rotaria sordida TaxID=392033 RepID=A0A815JL61_9BILA|nr:unnamed protein product [Rotaria sordida]CAF1427753.1 unnamed protein product [Rotaria sordida]CAF4234862.1 unnamed protein product [Rotaria sordida]CAF4235278.1 unnamed protein product [Rotaria sordida]
MNSKKNSSLIIDTINDGDFRITKQAIERRQNLDINQIENIRQVKVLNIEVEKDDVVSCDDIYLYQAQLKNTKKSEVDIVPNANHLFTGKERELINIIQSWIQQSID